MSPGNGLVGPIIPIDKIHCDIMKQPPVRVDAKKVVWVGLYVFKRTFRAHFAPG
jgi:hypothetical protein